MQDLATFLNGGLAVTCFAVGIAFLRFWRVSKDRFFIFFAAAFWAFAFGSVLRTFFASESEHGYLIFLPRLIGFLIIIAGILDKNRRRTD